MKKNIKDQIKKLVERNRHKWNKANKAIANGLNFDGFCEEDLGKQYGDDVIVGIGGTTIVTLNVDDGLQYTINSTIYGMQLFL